MTPADVRETPPELFKALDGEFHFTLDACANHANAKVARYYTEHGWQSGYPGAALQPGVDGLTGSWVGERVWCNPPFSDIRPWVEKAWMSAARCVVMLVPANRTEQPWWQDLVEPHRDIGKHSQLTVRFLRGRTHFLKEGKPILNPKTGKRSSPDFGCCLLIWS